MKELHSWFQKNKRQLPWRESPTPYKVWISEVMLQQTRASVVIPYFEKWLEIFPDVFALAEAPIEKVIKVWEGLGYYSRARNLHLGAKEIVERFSGKIPSTREELATIRGLGPYTIGAILSFGFRKRAAAVDGNVLRVLSRYFCIEENVCKTPVRKMIQEKAEALLDRDEPWVTVEALIELGATVCRPKPDCHACPLREGCLGKEKAELLPIKNEEQKTTRLKRAVFLIEADGKILVKKGEAGKVMADLYEFPFFEMDNVWTREKMVSAVKKLGVNAKIVKKLPNTSHTFTRYKAELYPFRMKAKNCLPVDGYIWIEEERLNELPFSSGHRRILSL